MASVRTILAARRGRGKPDWTDWFSYSYLLLGLVLMFGPVLWHVSLEQRVHHRRRDADHAAVQRHGRIRAVEVPLRRARCSISTDHLDTDDSANDHPGAQLSGRVRARAAEQPLGSHLARGGDA